ncbi:phosphate carrier mitochondrial-like protein [Labeo rohita]|uniref:Solute carrier family 25 member 3 n=1 Tax=Labeo rohita TaxID=84645 RepID=A0A498MFJ7_LABRO|nr:phosphate carrier mitochondrial-like protein [Labeo rohita]
MYPTTLTQLARSNPFQAPLFSVKPDQQEESPQIKRKLAAAAYDDADVSCEYGSNKYYLLCGFGGVLSCGLTHTAVVPLDLIKCRIQVDPVKYKSIFNGFSVTLREDGFRGLGKGWAPTFIGYSMQGLCKFGFYEVFKSLFYKGVYPLWLRQIPYTMMKFACFERTVETLYKYVVPKPRSECSKPEQLVVTFVAGYIAGVFCAVVSHPADSVVSVLNKERGSSAVEVVKRLGPVGVWKGLFARIIMIGTLTALQWFIYDSVKVYFRLPRPPPPEMPESLKRKMGLLDY